MWVTAVWSEFEQLHRTASVLSDFVTAIEGDKTARGFALEQWICVRGHLENLKPDLPQRIRSRLDEMCDKRDALFFRYVRPALSKKFLSFETISGIGLACPILWTHATEE